MSYQTAEVGLREMFPQSSASFKIMDVRVHGVQIPDVVEQMEHWIAQRNACHFIAVTGMHGVSESPTRPHLKANSQ